METRTPIFVANWKMNKLVRDIPEFIHRFGELMRGSASPHEVAIAPPFLYLPELARNLEGKSILRAAQNCGTTKFGAYTGEISPVMLREFGVEWVILGHSERRHIYKEDDALVAARLKAALEEGLKVILCVGETLQERKAGKAFQTVETQLSILKPNELPQALWERLIIAYEPVWAIGTGENASPEQAQEVQAFIRKWAAERFSPPTAQKLRILYGGSVKPENAKALMGQKDVDGFLIGTASLDPTVFAGVIQNGLSSHGLA